jgi:CRISPR-associated endonuclease/helicase Cas3
MPFYAHTVPGRPEAEWEELSVHLAEVEAAAAKKGARFGAQALAGLAGRLHDLGKYGPDFQARLRDPRVRADHSTAGAVWAFRNLAPQWGRLLAHVVAGHHAGLQDDLLDVDGRLETKGALLDVAEHGARQDGFVLLKNSVAGPRGMRCGSTEHGFRLAFLTRMVFSCLIDADRLAAAGMLAQAVEHPSIAALEAQLLASMPRLEANPSNINMWRDAVRTAALARAADPPGVFTLTVPTGGGKTLTSLAFALAHAREHGLDRVVIVIPFTSIIEQTAREYREKLGELGDAVLEHHSAFDMEDEAKWARARVGPERLRLHMERWDHPIVVTTAVQFFESLFSNRPSRCRKLHSLARSVIVLDEAQTMPLHLLRPCVLALKELARNYGSTVVLCTATQPALSAPKDGGPGFEGGFREPRELASDVPGLFMALRRVTVRDIGKQDDAALAALMAEKPQTLCIVNQRAHARVLFEAIHGQPGARHLSTCMHSVHRSRVLAEIREDLKHGRPCRVVSTSLIEAGVDVDFPRVLRASAGLDQIAQAAGRCNREFRNKKPEESEVLVFEAAEYGVIRPLKANAEVGSEMLKVHAADPFAPEAIRAFFEMLYWRKTDAELDRHGVLAVCEDHKADMNFPFERIAGDMRFIDDVMVPVIVAAEEAEAGEVDGLVRDLRFATGVGGIARKLGRYTVGVPRRVRAEMITKGVAERIRGDEFGDQFVVLLSLELYEADRGLDWDDLTFRKADGLIVS